MTIGINGRSLATAVLARCLQINNADFVIGGDTDKNPSGPQYICINDVAISLLQDLFPELIGSGKPLGNELVMREVIWGDDATPKRISQQALVADVRGLTTRLFELMPEVQVDDGSYCIDWDVNPGTPKQNHLVVGDRVMLTSEVELQNPIDPARSLMESLLDGWMFLAPIDKSRGILQAMTPKPPADPLDRLRELLDHSALIAPHIGGVEQAHMFSAAPSICLPIVGKDSLYIGNPGVRLDPISGEGVPFAIRTAILAAAVLTHDGDATDAVDHYQQRILSSFQKHLSGCQEFYMDAFSLDREWVLELRKSQIARTALESAFARSDEAAFPFRLEGLKLNSLAAPLH